jgi:hypothetical protein
MEKHAFPLYAGYIMPQTLAMRKKKPQKSLPRQKGKA